MAETASLPARGNQSCAVDDPAEVACEAPSHHHAAGRATEVSGPTPAPHLVGLTQGRLRRDVSGLPRKRDISAQPRSGSGLFEHAGRL